MKTTCRPPLWFCHWPSSFLFLSPPLPPHADTLISLTFTSSPLSLVLLVLSSSSSFPDDSSQLSICQSSIFPPPSAHLSPLETDRQTDVFRQGRGQVVRFYFHTHCVVLLQRSSEECQTVWCPVLSCPVLFSSCLRPRPVCHLLSCHLSDPSPQFRLPLTAFGLSLQVGGRRLVL